ncbi:MAG: hypothetical protein ABEJ91_03820 [Candidatus Nanohaloarchaea archaeon]
MKKIALVFAVLLIASGAAAHLSLEQDRLDEMKKLYNKETEHVPPVAGSILGDQTLVAHIEFGNTTKNATVVFDGVHMEKLERGTAEEPTVELWTSAETINRIGEAKKPVPVLKKKLNSGELEYQVYGFFNQLKFSIAKAFL